MSFARPLLLFALLLLPLWWWVRHRRLKRSPGTAMSDVRPLLEPDGRSWVARLPLSLRSTCLAAWIVAAAGPRVGAVKSEVRTEGIAIALTLDISTSMRAEDFAPLNRLEVARQTAIEFVRARAADRVGIVVFAGQALTLVPVTTDQGVLERALLDLRFGLVEDGTAIGTAIATAANRLRRLPGPSRVIVLLTDGENNRGTIDPRTAAQAAGALGIRIYAIGVGTIGEAPVPTGQGLQGLRYQMMPVRIDEPLLTELATNTGGRYYRATDRESLRNVFREIDRLEKSPVQRIAYRRYEEAYRAPLALGLLVLALEILVAGTFAVRVP